MLHNPLELEILVAVREAEREEARRARHLLAGADRDTAGRMAGIRRAAGLRLIALGERLAGRADGHLAGSGVPLRPVGNGIR